MVISGFNTHGIFLSILSSVNNTILPNLPAMVHLVVGAILTLLNLLITLGGFTVVLGGLLVVSRRVLLGSVLIAFGGGAGFPSLLLLVSYYFITAGTISVLLHAGYWAGVLTICGDIALDCQRHVRGISDWVR